MHQILKSGTVLVIACSLGIVPARPAWAGGEGGNNPTASASVGPRGLSAQLQASNARRDAPVGEGDAPASGSASAVPNPCAPIAIPGFMIPGPSGSTNGYWLSNPCKSDVSFLSAFGVALLGSLGLGKDGIAWVPAPTAGSPGGPVVSPSAIAQRVLAHAPWPRLTVRMNPPADRLAVNFPIWLSVSGWRSVSVTAALGGVAATVSARPVSARWVMGDGGVVVCAGPGRAYEPRLSWQTNLAFRSCGYTYASPSASTPTGGFTVTLTVVYAVTWTVRGEAGGGSLGTYDRRATLSVTVGEIESLDG